MNTIGTGSARFASSRGAHGSRLLGVPAGRVTLIAFMLSGALAGAAGVLIGVHYAAITPYIGVEIGLKAIAVMVVGGTTRIWGALIAGPLMGVVEVMTVAYGGSQIRDFVVYGFMILILLLRPQGLLGGGRSPAYLREVLPKLAEIIANAKLVITPEFDHNAPDLGDPARVARLIRA